VSTDIDSRDQLCQCGCFSLRIRCANP